jgi:hypothetical protein
MNEIAGRLSKPELLHPQGEGQDQPISVTPAPANARSVVSPIPVSVPSEHEDSWGERPVEGCGPAAIPASFVSEVTKHLSPSARIQPRAKSMTDIISQGILTLEQAEMLFNVYITKHDNYIYSVLVEGSTLATIRASSPLLLAAICSVTSLHTVSLDIPYEQCYQEFVRLSATHAFSSRNNLDDIRALCIGAFWLPDLSWILIGTG